MFNRAKYLAAGSVGAGITRPLSTIIRFTVSDGMGMAVINPMPLDWREALGAHFDSINLESLDRYVTAEREQHDVYPPAGQSSRPYASLRSRTLEP